MQISVLSACVTNTIYANSIMIEENNISYISVVEFHCKRVAITKKYYILNIWKKIASMNKSKLNTPNERLSVVTYTTLSWPI
jgi:DNA-directed RNA polymerase beta' subunit